MVDQRCDVGALRTLQATSGGARAPQESEHVRDSGVARVHAAQYTEFEVNGASGATAAPSGEYELVHAQRTRPGVPRPGCFIVSSSLEEGSDCAEASAR
jgi:hypothetical protein